MSVRNSEYEAMPGEKICGHCDAKYKRNPKYGREQWRTSSFCSPKCANEETHTRHGAARRGLVL